MNKQIMVYNLILKQYKLIIEIEYNNGESHLMIHYKYIDAINDSYIY